MEIIFNNLTQQVQEETSVQIVLNNLIGENLKGIAVAVNQVVVPRAQWANHILKDSDNVLVIKAAQGG